MENGISTLSAFGKKKFNGIWEVDDPLRGGLDIGGNGAGGYVVASQFYKGQFGLLILKSCFAQQGNWKATVSWWAKKNDAYWLGSGFEASGVTWGIEDAARNAR